jgi:hypothetical protein
VYRGAIHNTICEISVVPKNLFVAKARIVNLFPGYSDIPLKRVAWKGLIPHFGVMNTTSGGWEGGVGRGGTTQ